MKSKMHKYNFKMFRRLYIRCMGKLQFHSSCGSLQITGQILAQSTNYLDITSSYHAHNTMSNLITH